MSEVTPLPAATVVLVRDTAGGPEVLMLQRNYRSGFMPGMHVFPGGALEEADASVRASDLCTGLDETAACRMLALERGALAYWVAAIRESFEEAGVLMACGASGKAIPLADDAVIERFRQYRDALNAGKGDFLDMLRKEGLKLPVDQLAFFSHWITPVGAPRRYDTRFFAALAPEGQEALHDNIETIAYDWLRPALALDRFRRDEIKMRTPTWKTLELLAAFDTAAAMMDGLRKREAVPALLPRIDKQGRRLLPGEPGYEAAGTREGRGEWQT